MSKFRIFLGVIKTVTLVVAGVLTILCLMALAGLVVDNSWAQLGFALVVSLGAPALVADRLLPADASKNNGVVTDVYSLLWLGFALAFLALTSVTGDLLRSKANDFQIHDKPRLARLTAWLAGPDDVAPTPAELAEPALELNAGGGPEDAAAIEAAIPSDAGVDAQESTKEPESRRDFTPAEIFKEMSPAVVTVTTHNGPVGMGGGTGFIVDASGIVVTNYHVIAGASSVAVKLIDGSWASDVELLVQDKDQDLAILKIDSSEELSVVVVGDSDTVQVGERAISIGNPLGLEHTLTDGLVSARRTYEGKKMIQMSTPVSPGNSGGPLFNLRGEVIGVSTAQLGSYRRGQNLNLAIPINHAMKLITGDYPDRKRLGGGSPSGKGSW